MLLVLRVVRKRRITMLPSQDKRYAIKVNDIRNTMPNASVIVYANSVSKAVELFLQEYLKNSRLTVEIVEHDFTVRKV
jgi:hypothetical protein